MTDNKDPDRHFKEWLKETVDGTERLPRFIINGVEVKVTSCEVGTFEENGEPTATLTLSNDVVKNVLEIEQSPPPDAPLTAEQCIRVLEVYKDMSQREMMIGEYNTLRKLVFTATKRLTQLAEKED